MAVCEFKLRTLRCYAYWVKCIFGYCFLNDSEEDTLVPFIDFTQIYFWMNLQLCPFYIKATKWCYNGIQLYSEMPF